ncbi:ankyrin repeat-containing domain protein [Aspergillus transmontanensis]|uniref:Ankyrin repeat-containing domain protein n=1 Tax=Aspergillus transmontanensis TaxID=1034304 RepID=A0A5N6VM73_9EURO|nr:ankyrin repeat-containing domain protein [Aspergillus transmontanensis]
MCTVEQVPAEVHLLLVEYPPKDQLSYLQVFRNIIKLLLPRHVNEDQFGSTIQHLLAWRSSELLTRLVLQNMRLPVDKEDKYLSTPLVYAIYSGHEFMVELLLRDVNLSLHDARSPLFTAVETGHLSIVKLLVDQQAVDFAAEFATNPTPLEWAIASKQREMVNFLFEATQTKDFAKSNLARLFIDGNQERLCNQDKDMICVLIDAFDNTNPMGDLYGRAA